ncbi:MAG: hypothetical protein K9M36_01715 [Candidatus Pacebacteria bacterium]|nr:hypothetical protein [Candidatus Paceibacterota bacterium]
MILLNKFQDVSDWFQEWFGINNFTIARICFVLSVCLLGWARIISLSMVKEIDFFVIIGTLFDLAWIAIVFSWMQIMKYIEEVCLDNPHFGNFLAIKWSLFRIVFSMFFLWVVFAPIGVETSHPEKSFMVIKAILLKLEHMFIVLGFYFASCTPKPHKTSKVKKWWKSFVESIDSAISGVFSPAPELATVRIAKNRRVAQRPILATGSVIFIY